MKLPLLSLRRASTQRLFSTCRILCHENPLGLPRSGSPPQLPRMQRGLPPKRKIPSVDKVILVSSAKGGVGKSTIATNLALAISLTHPGRTGILDVDLFGPSIPTLLGLADMGEPRLTSNNQLVPMVNHGLKSMSMGYLIPNTGAPVVWRGLMVMKAVQQLLWEVDWGGLDVLVVDLPPGTGDVQLTVSQQVIVDGAVIVSTPQDIALIDAVKGVNMFKKMDIPILGMVQNMSHFICPNCSHSSTIFGHGPDELNRRCKELEIELLGDIPLHASICHDADRGKPTVVASPEGPHAQAFKQVARKVEEKLWE